MSASHELPDANGGVEDKSAFRVSSDKTSQRYELDGVDDADAVDDIYSRANAPRPGFTKNDQKDMYRMGKLQEFRVGSARPLPRRWS